MWGLAGQALKSAGVDEVVLAINYQPKVSLLPSGCMQTCMQQLSQHMLRPRMGSIMLEFRAAQVMMDFLKEWEEKLAIKITCSQACAPWPCTHAHAAHVQGAELRVAYACTCMRDLLPCSSGH